MVFTAILLDWGAFDCPCFKEGASRIPRETHCVSSRLSTFEVIGVPSKLPLAVERA